MDSLERLYERIEYGRELDKLRPKIFFSLEPTFEFTLKHYLLRRFSSLVTPEQLLSMSNLELMCVFEELTDTDKRITNQIKELYHAITDFRLIFFAKGYRFENDVIRAKKDRLQSSDYYLNLMEDVINKLTERISIPK